MASNPQLSAKAQESLGLPPGFKAYSPFPFAGMNVQASPIAVADNEFTWVENFIRVGDGNLRTAWDAGAAIYTTPTGQTVVYYAFFTIGTDDYCAVFLSNGTAYQIDLATNLTVQIGLTTGFYNPADPGNLPCVKQWGAQYLLISNNNTQNDFWAWDGSILYGPGTAAPQGVNLLSGGNGYQSAPNLTVFGGFGSGMAITPVVDGGSVVEMTITNPGSGYLPGDIVQVAFNGGGNASSSPILVANLSPTTVAGVSVSAGGMNYTYATVNFTGGGGSGASATATILNGSVESITISNPGSGYTTAPGVVISGDGTGALAYAVLTPGGLATGPVASGVASIAVDVAGSGYASATYASILPGGGGSGATAGSVSISGGSVASIAVGAAGSGYTTPPPVLILGAGTGAKAHTVLSASATQAGVTVVDGGSGFTSVPLITITGGGGSGATAIAVLTATSVASVNLTAGGSGYTSAPTVGFTGGGGGSGAAATAYLSGDAVGNIVVTSSGSGYTGPLEVTFSGGGGSGAGATVLFQPTSIASVTVSSTGEFYTTAPAVEVSAGANTAAYATVTLMPFGVSGSAMETYQSRAWLVDPAAGPFSTTPPGGNWNVSAPGGFTDFATSDGAVAALNTDSFLQKRYTNIHQSSGYLYFFGDGSVSVVSNVSTAQASGSSTVSTTYNYQNVDPQTGAAWRDSLQDFGRSSIFANSTGIYGLYGGTASKISAKLDQLFQNAVFPPTVGAVTPTSATATLFNIKHYMLMMTVQDPDTLALRNVMATWNEKDWVITSQSVAVTSISTRKSGSSYSAYGCDGTKIYPLFATPSASLQKRFDTKQYGADRMFIQKQVLAVYLQAQDNSVAQAGVTGSFSLVVSGVGIQNPTFPSGQSLVSTNGFHVQPSFPADFPYWPLWGTSMGGIYFVTAGLRFTSNAPDFTLGNVLFGYLDKVAYFGQ